MTEATLQLISSLKVLLVAGFATLYGLGGMSGKWKRRFIAPVLYGIGIAGFTLWTNTFNAWSLLCVPLLFGGLSLGYGASTTAEKIKKRAIAGSAAACCSIPIFVITGAWTLLFLHILVCTATSIVAGTWNQTQSARAEETLIGASYVLIPILTI
jgi:hypothetical protein